MKKLLPALAFTGLLALPSQGGTISSGKEYKTYKEPVAVDLFKDTELQIDVFGSLGYGETTKHTKKETRTETHRERVTVAPPAPPPPPTPQKGKAARTSRAKIVDSGPGFVVFETRTTTTRRVGDGEGGIFEADHAWGGGVGVNYFFLRYFGVGVEGDWLDGGENAIHLADSNLFLRYPITFQLGGQPRGIAPYIFGGYGGKFDGVNWGQGHAGTGIEFRLCPRLALFLDGRYIFGHDDSEGALARTGLRVIF